MRNVVMVSIDSLRADHCGFMGYDKDTTPNLDRLAQNGVVYENAIAPGPSTPQSMPAIFTGSYPHQQVDSDDFNTRTSIETHLNKTVSIPEKFKELGYTTAGFTPNPFTSRHYGFDSGFDKYHDFLGNDSLSSELRSRIVTRWIQNETVAGTRFLINMLGLGDISMTWESYYEEAVEWTESVEEPYFLWLFLLEPHWPYRPPRRYRNQSLVSMYRTNWQRAPVSSMTPTATATDTLFDLYDGGIQHADELLGRLESEFPGDPAIFVHADHGEEFGEHGNYGHGQLYEETIHVPFVVGNIEQSDVVTSPVSLSRLPAILTNYCRNNELEADQDSRDPIVIARKGDNQVAARGQRWKYISDESPELYDLVSDHPETRNLIDSESETADVFRGVTSRHRSHMTERTRISTATSDVLGSEVL